MTIPERLLAMFLGVTAVPLRTIYINVQSAFHALAIGFSALFWGPAFISTVLDRRGFSFHQNFLATAFLVVPISVVLILTGLILAGIYSVCSTIIDLFAVTWSGLTTGFTEGMEGFWRLWASQTSNLDWILLWLQDNTYQFAEEHRIHGVEDFDLMGIDIAQLADVETASVAHEIPNLQAATSSMSTVSLTPEDLNKAESLNNEFLELSVPPSPNLKSQVSQLRAKVEHYKELECRLHEVHQALIEGDTTTIQNEMIDGLNVVTPILWFKQYEKENHWYVVPGSSHVTDKDTLLHWLELNPRDPTNRDIVKEPTKYKEMPTRYRWHLLTSKFCSSQELHETAVEVHQLLDTLPGQLESIKQHKMTCGGVPQAFFSASRTRDTEQSTIEHSVVYQLPG